MHIAHSKPTPKHSSACGLCPHIRSEPVWFTLCVLALLVKETGASGGVFPAAAVSGREQRGYWRIVNVKVAVWVVLELLVVLAEAVAVAWTVTTFVLTGTMFGVGPPQPIAPPASTVPTNSRSSMPRTRTVNDRRRHAMKPPSNRLGRRNIPASVGPGVVLFSAIVAVPLAVVVMVNFEVCTVFEPSAVTVGGTNVQSAPAGKPEQEKPTVPTNPPYGVKVKVVVAD
jgi:hypothetical protein